MTQKQRYDKFINFIGHKSNDWGKEFFKTSESSFKRWKSGDTPVPEWTIRIIELHEETVKLSKSLGNKEFELMGIKQSIYDYKKAQEELFNVIDS